MPKEEEGDEQRPSPCSCGESWSLLSLICLHQLFLLISIITNRTLHRGRLVLSTEQPRFSPPEPLCHSQVHIKKKKTEMMFIKTTRDLFTQVQILYITENAIIKTCLVSLHIMQSLLRNHCWSLRDIDHYC